MQFQARHKRLLAERDDYYGGNAPQGEVAGWVARRLDEDVFDGGTVEAFDSNEGNEGRGLLNIWIDLALLYIKYDTESREGSDGYHGRIVRLLETFQYPIPSRIVAGVVGCSPGHARRFYWDEDTQCVREKNWARSQRQRQAGPGLVKRAKQRDNERCVRCRNTNQLVAHHIRPVSKSGEPNLENLATLCRTCHLEAHGGNISQGDVVYSYDNFWNWATDTSPLDGAVYHRQSSLCEFAER